MAGSILQDPDPRSIWALVERQHGVIARAQLLELGLTRKAIEHRIAAGRLHPVLRGVYAVGRPRLTPHAYWMAAVLSCGPNAVLSHWTAAALWGLGRGAHGTVEVSVPAHTSRRPAGVTVHRRTPISPEHVTRHHGIPVTSPTWTLVDLASCVEDPELEAAIADADRRGLVGPEALRAALDGLGPRPGVRTVRRLLDRDTFTLTDSELERRFLPIARSAGLPVPQTQCHVNGFRVDFYWPDLGLVVETDGLRHHRTAAQQVKDHRRDQAHTAAGLIALRFTRAQVRFQPAHVEAVLANVARRLASGSGWGCRRA